MQEIACEHYKSGTITIKNKCNNKEHDNINVKICKQCKRDIGNGIVFPCFFQNCNDAPKREKAKLQEFVTISNRNFKAGFINIAQLMFEEVETNPNKGEKKKINGYNMLGLQDWRDVPDIWKQSNEIQDDKNVSNIRPVVRLEKKEESEILQLPFHSSTCQYTSSQFMLTGGIKEETNEGEDAKLYITNECFKIRLITSLDSVELIVDKLMDNSNKEVVMNESRVGHQTVVIEDKVYVLGGNNLEKSLSSCEVFNTQKPTQWEKIADMPEPRSRYTAVVRQEISDDGFESNYFIYIIGGFSTKDSKVGQSTILKYDVTKNQWSTLSLKKQLGKKSFQVCAGGYGFCHPQSKQIYVVGGVNNQGEGMDTILKLEDLGNGKYQYVLIGALQNIKINPKGIITKICPRNEFEKNQGDVYQIIVSGTEFLQKNKNQNNEIMHNTNIITEYFSIKDGKIVNQGCQDYKKDCTNLQIDQVDFSSQFTMPVSGYVPIWIK